MADREEGRQQGRERERMDDGGRGRGTVRRSWRQEADMQRWEADQAATEEEERRQRRRAWNAQADEEEERERQEERRQVERRWQADAAGRSFPGLRSGFRGWHTEEWQAEELRRRHALDDEMMERARRDSRRRRFRYSGFSESESDRSRSRSRSRSPVGYRPRGWRPIRMGGSGWSSWRSSGSESESGSSSSESESESEREEAGVRGASEVASDVEEELDLPDDQVCVICLCARRVAGYLHKGTVHMCVCKRCSAKTMAHKRKVACPICMQSSTAVTVFS